MGRITSLAAGMLTALPLLSPVQAQSGPSFDCDRATQADEIAICASSELSALDRDFSRTYRTLRDVGYREQALAAARAALRRRAQCGSDVSCIREVLTEAIAEFAQIGRPAQPRSPEQKPLQSIRPVGSGWAAGHAPGTVLRGRCHMGVCSFSQVKSVEEIASTDAGALFKLTTIGAQVEVGIADEGMTEYDAVEVPAFTGPPRDMFVHCSTSRPAVIARWGEGDRWIVHPLGVGTPDDVFGFNMSSHAHYWYVCEGESIAAGEIYTPEQQADAVRRGYRESWAWSDEGQLEFGTFAEVRDFLGASG